jgi:Mrp family chromosome partitioning ATPase
MADAYVTYKVSQPIPTVPERGRVITAASLPGSPSRPNIPLNVAAGLLVGLVLGFLTALLRDRLDDRLRGAGELERRGLPVLAVLPPSREPVPAPDVVVMRAPDSTAARAYGALGEQVLVATRTAPAAVVVVASPMQDNGTSSVSVNLAVALALSGSQVAVVDADTRSLQPEPDRPNDKPGLLDVLSHRVSLHAALQATRVPRLTLLPVGHRTPGSTAQLIGSRWAEASVALSRSFDLVVVAAAPILASADAVRVTEGSAGVVVVVRDRHSKRSDLDRLVTELGRIGAGVLGCVLIEQGRGWHLLGRLRRGNIAQRRADHPDDYARELSTSAPGPQPVPAPPAPAENGQGKLDPVALRDAAPGADAGPRG